MKVLLLGDASNYNVALAKGLRALGHEVTLASNGGRWLHTRRDIDLYRPDTRMGGAILLTRMATVLAPRLRGYDVVQMVSPGFADLRPTWLKPLLRRLKRNNGALYLTALGTDSAYVRNLSGSAPALDYSEWQVGGRPTAWAQSDTSEREHWLKPHLQEYNDFFYNNIDGIVTALYEYDRVVRAEFPGIPTAYGGIPVDMEALPAARVRPTGEKVRVQIGAPSHRLAEKGADVLIPMLEELSRELPDVEIVSPPNMPYDSFIATLAQADVVCDQLYSYTPATTALLAMSMGVVPVTGGEEAYYDFIGERSARPIFNPDPRDLDGTRRRLRALLTDREALRTMSAAGPDFVSRHNAAEVVARRFTDFWERH